MNIHDIELPLICDYTMYTCCRSTVAFSVSVLEYRNSSFLTLSTEDLDQMLKGVPKEECRISIDTVLGKAMECDLAAGTMRNQRDLSKCCHCVSDLVA